MSAARATPALASAAQDHLPDHTTSAPRHDAAFEVSTVSVGARGSWLRAAGELDLATAGNLADALEQQCTTGRCLARLDLSAVSFIDCSGLEVLVGAHHQYLAAGGTLVLTGVGYRVARLLVLTGLDQTLFTIPQATDRSPTQDAIAQQAGVAVRAEADEAVGNLTDRARTSGWPARDRDAETERVQPAPVHAVEAHTVPARS